MSLSLSFSLVPGLLHEKCDLAKIRAIQQECMYTGYRHTRAFSKRFNTEEKSHPFEEVILLNLKLFDLIHYFIVTITYFLIIIKNHLY